MRFIVVYVSKTGNTKCVAERIAGTLQIEARPLNLIEKKGRGTKEERDTEKEYFNRALHVCKDADLVIIGTPTSFRKAHSKAIRFTRQVEARNVGLFCTYTNKVGTTLTDLEEILQSRGINHVGSLDIGGLKTGKFSELDESQQDEIFSRATMFVQECIEGLKKTEIG